MNDLNKNRKIVEYQQLVNTNSVTMVFQAIWLVRYLWLMDNVHLPGDGQLAKWNSARWELLSWGTERESYKCLLFLNALFYQVCIC